MKRLLRMWRHIMNTSCNIWRYSRRRAEQDEDEDVDEDRDGIVCLARLLGLLHPLLLTLAAVTIATPAVGLLAAIVHRRGGSIVSLGLLAASVSLGALLGAVYAGSHGEGDTPIRRYASYGLAVAAALVLFAVAPVSLIAPLPLAIIGFAVFAEVVWNTSRVRLQAEPIFQARL